MSSSRMLPDLETSIQQYRQGFIFAMQNHMYADAIVFLNGMNKMLPHNKRVHLLSLSEVLEYNHIGVTCPKCKQSTNSISKIIYKDELGAYVCRCENTNCKEQLDITNQINNFLAGQYSVPDNSIGPSPENSTLSQLFDLDVAVVVWVTRYHDLVEGALSDYRTGYSSDKE